MWRKMEQPSIHCSDKSKGLVSYWKLGFRFLQSFVQPAEKLKKTFYIHHSKLAHLKQVFFDLLPTKALQRHETKLSMVVRTFISSVIMGIVKIRCLEPSEKKYF